MERSLVDLHIRKQERSFKALNSSLKFLFIRDKGTITSI